jgi:hypothetical protein
MYIMSEKAAGWMEVQRADFAAASADKFLELDKGDRRF